MSYAIVNEKGDTRLFLCGSCELQLGWGMVVSPVIFNAEIFTTKKEAKQILKQMQSKDWVITEIIGGIGNLGDGDFVI